MEPAGIIDAVQFWNVNIHKDEFFFRFGQIKTTVLQYFKAKIICFVRKVKFEPWVVSF
jgi:hypothetical protein